ncbi:MAG: S1 RNA-binding domain-containing protein, partial [Bacteroidales bacterium]|nr:S1 RNA-binding domain-containing protein [Bacteroidales bacterium]
MKRPVSGIAMGLITDTESDKYAILSDILGDEDHLGDMDFKVTGTRNGITATQMDIKCDGLSYEILEKALNQAKEGRFHILDIIEKAMPAPREDYKPHVPRIETMTIPKELIGAVIGPGGKIIQGIQEQSGATVSIEEVEEGGYIEIAATNKEAMDKALELINAIVELPEEGKVYTGKVRSILDFGAFVEFMPNRDGLLHISEISWDRIPDMESSGIKEGDNVEVKLIEIDKKSGKYRLSMRALQPKPEGYVERERQPREGGDRRNNDRGPRRDNNRGPRRDNNRNDRGPRREQRDNDAEK